MLSDEMTKMDKRIKKKIYLTEDQTAYVNLHSGEITFMDETGNPKMDRYNPGSYWFKLLSLLIVRHGTYINALEIASTVYEQEEPCGVEDQVDSLYREIRKKRFFPHVRGKGFKLSKLKGSFSYAAFIPNQEVEEAVSEVVFPEILTGIKFVSVPKSELIHRDEEIRYIKSVLSEGERAINIAGSGGIGKTSLAKILFEEIRGNYDAVGWMEYKGNLKESILHSFLLFPEEPNDEKRWSAIVSILRKNTKKKILLFVDNLSFDSRNRQDPRTDNYLRELTGLMNITIILTSRFILDGYRHVVLETLGNKDNPEPCVDLFCLYNHHADKIRQGETIRKLVDLCQYHTFAIELVARACAYGSVEEYYSLLKNAGFRFPMNFFATAHGEYMTENADEQIRKLFDLDTRTRKEVYALNVFSLLPEMETLSEQEMNCWFGVILDDIRDLLEEAWIRYENNAFFIHPLVKEATLLRCDSWAIAQAADSFMDVLQSDALFHDYDARTETVRKLWIANEVLLHSSGDSSDRYLACLITGDMARSLGIREIALTMYRKALSDFEKNDALQKTDPIHYWRATYYYGYILSYTRTGLKDAEELIRKALVLLDGMEANEEILLYKAKAMDHLGYILADKEWEEEDTEAQNCFRESMRILKKLNKESPESRKYQKLIGWVEDNWGYLLSSMGEEESEQAERHLKHALELRKKFSHYEPSDEVAWSCNTLGSHYLIHKHSFSEAEALFVEAIQNYEALNQQLPGMHNASVACSHNNYWVLLLFMGDERRLQEAVNHLNVAMTMYYQELGEYEYEYAQVLNNWGCVAEFAEETEKAVELYREALQIYDGSEYVDDTEVVRMNLSRADRPRWVRMEKTEEYVERQRFLFLQCGSRRRLVNVTVGVKE